MLFLDRTGGGKFCEEYELATSKLQEFSETLRREQEERKNLIKVLEDGGAFFDVAYGEVKVIVHVSSYSTISVTFIDASVFLDCQGDIHINSFSAYGRNERLIKLYSTVVTLFKVEHMYLMYKLC